MEYRLDELFDLQMGKTPSRNNPEYWNTKDNKWISIADLSKCGKYIDTTKECISNKAVSESGIAQIPENTVIMSFKLSIGKTAITTESMYSNEAIISFRDKHIVEVLPEYLYYLVLSKDWSAGTNKAVMGKTLNKATLSKIKVNIYDISQQHEVVDILDKVNNVILSRKQELQKLDELVKSRFIELFGDPNSNEKGWTVSTLGEYMTLLTDFSANGSYELLDSNVVMYDEPNYAVMVRTTDLEAGNLTDGVKYIDQTAYELLSKSKLYGGELIMNKIGSAGKIYIMPQIDKPASLGRNAFMFRFDDRINMVYLYALLSSDYGTKEIQQYVRGAVTKTITKESTRSIRVIVPPIELQWQFATFVEQTDKSKIAVQQALDKAQLLFDSLMQKYFGYR